MGKNGQPFTFYNGPHVDPTGALEDGSECTEIRSFKKLLLKDVRAIARNITNQLITYPTGTPVRFGDRPALENILNSTQKSNRGLKGLGISLGLPLLDSMTPAFAMAAAPVVPRRFIGICNNLGLLPEKFFPTGTGLDYTPSDYLQHLQPNRNRSTVFSGVSHPDVDGGHPADIYFLTATPRPGSSGFRNTISLDQYVAERIGHLTRFPSLTLGVNIKGGAKSLSFTGSDVQIPSEESASAASRKLSLQGNPKQVAEQQRKLELGKSIMDTVAEQITGLQRKVGDRDRERLDQYFTGVRELETRMELSRVWEGMPKPKTNEIEPLDPKDPVDYMKKTELVYNLARLAFETDSTRMVTLSLIPSPLPPPWSTASL